MEQTGNDVNVGNTYKTNIIGKPMKKFNIMMMKISQNFIYY